MAQASRKVRKDRRLRRERNQASRAAESFMDNAYKSRVTAMALELELKKRDAALEATAGIIREYFEREGVGAPEDAEFLYNSIKAKFEAAPTKDYRGGSVTALLDKEGSQVTTPDIQDPVAPDILDPAPIEVNPIG